MGLVIYPSWLIACRWQLVIPHVLQDKSFKRGSNVNLRSSVSAWHAITRLHFVLCIPLPPLFSIHARGIKISTVRYWTLLLSCSHGLHIGRGVERHFHFHWYAVVVLLQMHDTMTDRLFSSWWCSHDVLPNNPHSFFFLFLEQWVLYIIYPFLLSESEWSYIHGWWWWWWWWMGAARLAITIRSLLNKSCVCVCGKQPGALLPFKNVNILLLTHNFMQNNAQITIPCHVWCLNSKRRKKQTLMNQILIMRSLHEENLVLQQNFHQSS